MPVKEKGEGCVVDVQHLRKLIQEVFFTNRSGQFLGCKYPSAIANENDKIERLKHYIKLVGSDQIFHDSSYDIDSKGKSVTCGVYVYFTLTLPVSVLIYRGKIDDVDYTETGSIIFKKDGAEK